MKSRAKVMPLFVTSCNQNSQRESLSLHRALHRVTRSAHKPMHTLKLFVLKPSKMLRHISIIRSSSGKCLFLAKITLLKTFIAWFSYNSFNPGSLIICVKNSIFTILFWQPNLYWFGNLTNKYILYYRHAATTPNYYKKIKQWMFLIM